MNKKLLFIIFYILFLNVFAKGRKEAYKGYSENIYEFKNQHELSVDYSTKKTNLVYAIPKAIKIPVSNIQFTNIKVKNLKNNTMIYLGKCTQSKKIAVKEYDSLIPEKFDFFNQDNYYMSFFDYGASYEKNHDTIDGKYVLPKREKKFVDYAIYLTVKCFDKDGIKIFQRDVEALMKRDYKEKKYGILDRIPQNWQIGDSRIYHVVGNNIVLIDSTDYHQRYGIIHINHYGQILSQDGVLIFKEDSARREVFYLTEDNYRDVIINGKQKTIWDLKKNFLKSKKYPYKTIYEAGYKP